MQRCMLKWQQAWSLTTSSLAPLSKIKYEQHTFHSSAWLIAGNQEMTPSLHDVQWQQAYKQWNSWKHRYPGQHSCCGNLHLRLVVSTAGWRKLNMNSSIYTYSIFHASSIPEGNLWCMPTLERSKQVDHAWRARNSFFCNPWWVQQRLRGGHMTWQEWTVQ